jgi:hypothetical protein
MADAAHAAEHGRIELVVVVVVHVWSPWMRRGAASAVEATVRRGEASDQHLSGTRAGNVSEV